MDEPTHPPEGEAAPRGDLLLLDNDARIVELVSWFLESQGFTVRTADSFAAARLQIAEKRPDLLISDVDLGAETAVAELPRLSAEGILPPTLVVSGFLDDQVGAALFAVPEVLDSLAKPFEFPDLEVKVVACLAGERSHRPTLIPSQAPPGPRPGADSAPAAAVEPSSVEDDEGWIEITPGG